MSNNIIQHLYTLEIPKFITKVQSSEKRRAKYYSNKAGPGRVNKCPVRLKNPILDDKGFYLDTEGAKILANIRSVGTPKFIPINGQILYVGKPWDRAKLKIALEEYFIPFVETLPIFTGSIIMETELHTTIGHDKGDLDNLGYMYGKVLTDTMVNMGKLYDDSVPYVTKPCSAPLFFPVNSDEDRKLVYHFFQDLRPEILKLNTILTVL